MDAIYLLILAGLYVVTPRSRVGARPPGKDAMSIDVLARGAACAVPVRLPAVRPAEGGAILMGANTMFGLLLASVPRRPRAVRQAARQLHRRCHGRAAELCAARVGGRLEGASLSALRDRSRRGDVLEAVRDRACCCSTCWAQSSSMGCSACSSFLPLNPQKFAAVSADSSFNTAVSFITNTNWQGYSGESTMGYLVQMAGLAVQNFLSAATGIAVAIALIRGFARHTRRRPSAISGWMSRAQLSMCCCRSRPCSRSCWRARVSSRISTATRTRRLSRRSPIRTRRPTRPAIPSRTRPAMP